MADYSILSVCRQRSVGKPRATRRNRLDVVLQCTLLGIVLKYVFYRISVKSRDDVTIQLMRQCSKLFDQEKILKSNPWQSMIRKCFCVIIDWSSIG